MLQVFPVPVRKMVKIQVIIINYPNHWGNHMINNINPFQRAGFRSLDTNSNKVLTSSTSRSLRVSTSSFSFNSKEISLTNTRTQTMVSQFNNLTFRDKQELGSDNPLLSNLTKESAAALIEKDGYYGIEKTSQRIADFVLNGAGDDMDRLKQGRKGILLGFEAAEKAWKGKLPDISYETIEKAVKSIDDKITELGGNILEITA